MNKEKALDNMLEAVVIFPSFLIVIFLLPPHKLISAPLNGEEFILLFAIPAIIGFFHILLNSVKKNNKPQNIILAILNGVQIGISGGYGLLSLIVLYNWQSNSNIGHLEPLFVALGIAAASVEGSRRLLKNKLTV